MNCVKHSKIYVILLTLIIATGIFAGTLVKKFSVAVNSDSYEIPLLCVMYHSFSTDKSKWNSYVISPRQFEEDMLYLIDNGYTFADTKDIISFTENKMPLSEKTALITIDDGHYSVYEYIYPIMKKYGIKAVISPIASESDRYTITPDPNPAYANMNWDNIKEIHSSGLADIQNHSYDMHKVNKTTRGCAKLKGESDEQYKNRLFSDLKKADDKIFEATGEKPICMVYPFGLTSKEARDVLNMLEYKMSISCTEGFTILSSGRECTYMIKRYNRPYGKTAGEFFENIFSSQYKK